MDGDVFVAVLKDLKREGWTEKAGDVETDNERRADRWKGEAYPFGSEMAWDSTGQEEVYAWCKYLWLRRQGRSVAQFHYRLYADGAALGL